MIQFEEVTKRYLGKLALDRVSLQFTPGKIIGIVGENGSGKSTTLKLAAGLSQPTKGKVTIDGEEVTRRTADKIAFLSELDTYYPFYTVAETIDFTATQFADFDREKAQEILEFMNIPPEQKVKHLSKGNRGRLKMILTLARAAPILLMDEPLSGLDPMVREAIVKSLISFIDVENQTVVLTTHEINEVEPLLDEVIAVHDGKIVDRTDVEDLREAHGISIIEWMKEIYEQERA